jgi:putative flavoprotein involved in K+ transport
MMERFDTVVIGAGQAGLAISHYLTLQNRDHVILEKRRIGEAWRSEKWDSFTLVTPNWMLRLPGFAYEGKNPDGFLSHDEVIEYLEDYAATFNPLIRLGVEVLSLESNPLNDGFVIRTTKGMLEANNVVVAVGLFQKPMIPDFSSQLSHHIYQLPSSQYRNPNELPDGAVLVVGSGQSGCQIAEELVQSGRKVYLSTGSTGRMPRRYRGKDIYWWTEKMGPLDQPVDNLLSPAARFASTPHVSSGHGGRALNPHQFVLDGVTLLGRLRTAVGSKVSIAGDLMENLVQSDAFTAALTAEIDKFIEIFRIEAPANDLPRLWAGYTSQIIKELDLDSVGIKSIIWATGYTFDFSWIQLPIFDVFGYPVQRRGITAQPGLYFVGLPWLHTLKSGLIAGVGDDAAHIAAHLADRAYRKQELRQIHESIFP